MPKIFFIRLIAIILTVSFMGEMTSYLQLDELVSIEMDADGENEEEQKEDKVKEFSIIQNLSQPISDFHGRNDGSVYLPLSWCSPTLANSTPPPQPI